MMRRGSNGGATDLLVCFPSRAAQLALMPPKAICSPSGSSSEPARRRRSTSRAGTPSSSSNARASRNPSRRRAVVDVPVDDDEPSSPKVTCAGKIKVRSGAKPKCSGGVGGGGKAKKKASWMQALGIKKDALPFLSALHGAFRLNVSGCFGAFPGAVEYAAWEEEEEEEEEERHGKEREKHGTALTKWFMVLEEGKKVPRKKHEQEASEQEEEEDSAPPANALMLMRCRSAPAKGLQRRLGGDAEEDEVLKSAKMAMEEEKENLVYMRYPPDFFQVSVDVAKETWVVGGDDDAAVVRCRSWKK